MFFIANIINLLSSYLIASFSKNTSAVFIVFFALIVLNIEILSLFKGINAVNILFLSFIFLLISIFVFKIKKAQFLKIIFDFKKLKNSLLLDKSLIILLIGFLLLIFITFFLSVIMPPLEPDSQTYHFFRAYQFIKNQSLNHFETNDIRALIMPFNSEIFYSYMLAFKKNLQGYGVLSFFSYILCLISGFNILEEFKFSYRKRLWAIFLFSSLSAVIIQIPSLQTDLCIGALLISAFSLYIKKLYYLSALSLALSLGVKTSGVFSLIGFIVLISGYEFLINKDFSKLKKYSLYSILNFFIFSSYNYILNFIQFNNPFANHASIIGHEFWGGFKGWIANIIRFLFQSFDFTGFKWGYYLNDKLFAIQKNIFDFLNIDYYLASNVAMEKVNIITDEQIAGFGIIGFLVFLPLIFISLGFYKNKRNKLTFLLSLVFIVNVLVLCFSMAYMVFSIRFIVSFTALSFIIFTLSYSKKSFFKYIIIFFSLFYMILIPLNIKRMPVYWVLKNLKDNNFNKEKFIEGCYRGKVAPELELSGSIKDKIKSKYKDKKNIAIIKKLSSSLLYLTTLEKEGYNIDFLNPALITYDKLNKYDLVILEDKLQDDNVFNPFDIEINYKIEKNKIIFENNKNLNCYYINTLGQITTNKKASSERNCFTYEYLKHDKNFKLDFKENVELKSMNSKSDIYYFNKSN